VAEAMQEQRSILKSLRLADLADDKEVTAGLRWSFRDSCVYCCLPDV